MIYSKLGEQQFRILQLSKPPSRTFGQAESAAEVKILTLSVDTRLQYTALSYTWGDSNDWGLVTIDGEDVRVSRSLARALKYLVRLGQTYVWADQLCINQADIDERSAQVQIMRNIYEKSSEVVVWLDEISERSDTPSFFLNYFTAEDVSEKMTDKLARRFIDDKYISQYLKDLVDCPYWRRAWIVQEIAVASKVRVLLQDHKVEWSRFELLPKLFNQLMVKGSTSEANLIFGLAADIQKSIAYIYTLRYIRERRGLSLPKIISVTTQTRQTDPRDAVYSKLALVSDFDRNIVSVDYTKDTRSVILDLVQDYIRSKNNINIITMVDRVSSKSKTRDLSLPTWVWDCGVQRDTNDHEVMHLCGIFGASSIELLFQASGDIEMNPSPFGTVNGKEVLVTRGFCWDRVDFSRSQATENDVIDSMRPFQAISLFCRTLTACHIFDDEDGFSAHFITQSHLVSFCRMLRHYFTHGSLRSSHRVDRILARIGKGNVIVYESLANLFRIQASFTFYGRTLREWAEACTDPEYQISWDENPQEENIAQALIKSILWMTMNRNVATGKLGQPYLVPGTANQGDLIVVLAGCALPVVIKEVEDGQFELVGECYVDGIMHGEAMKMALQRGGLEEIRLV